MLGSGWAGLSADGEDCFVVGEVNQQALFARTAAAEVPQVVVPQIVDQPYFARRVAELGIGAAHDGPTPTAKSLSDALRLVLLPQTQARARDVAVTIGTDGARTAARMLLNA